MRPKSSLPPGKLVVVAGRSPRSTVTVAGRYANSMNNPGTLGADEPAPVRPNNADLIGSMRGRVRVDPNDDLISTGAWISDEWGDLNNGGRASMPAWTNNGDLIGALEGRIIVDPDDDLSTGPWDSPKW